MFLARGITANFMEEVWQISTRNILTIAEYSSSYSMTVLWQCHGLPKARLGQSWNCLEQCPSTRLPTPEATHLSLPQSLPTNRTKDFPNRHLISPSSNNQKHRKTISILFSPNTLVLFGPDFLETSNIHHPHLLKLCLCWWPQRILPHQGDAWSLVSFSLAKLQSPLEVNFPNMLICLPMTIQNITFLRYLWMPHVRNRHWKGNDPTTPQPSLSSLYLSFRFNYKENKLKNRILFKVSCPL